MRATLLRIAGALLFCGAVAYLLWRMMGAVGIVVSAPLFGVALARLLPTLVGETARVTRDLALQDIEGRHYAFKGTPIDIVEDDDCRRWLSLDDVRAVLTGLPADAVLQRVLPGGVVAGGVATVSRIRAEALVDFLRKATDRRSLRFRHWLEREVVLPADKRRGRLPGRAPAR